MSIISSKRARWMISTISESLGIKKEAAVEVKSLKIVFFIKHFFESYP